MKDGFICVIDSGIGGLAVLKELIKKAPTEKYLYFGDNLNAPYGNKSKRKLWELTLNNLVYLSQFKLKAMVVGCNTLSVNFVNEIQQFLGVKTFGVFPPVESAIINHKNPLLICTNSTAKQYDNLKGVSVLGLKNLAYEIEENKYFLHNIDLSFLAKEIHQKNCLILGCTHYELLKNTFLSHFCPLKILCGAEYTANMVAKYLKNNKSLGKQRRFLVEFVGKNQTENRLFWEKVVKVD